jgi:hydrogenase maturation factor
LNPEELLFEARLTEIEGDDFFRWGWVDFKGVRTRVDLLLLPNIVEGSRILICGRVALAVVEENDEVCG